MIHHFDEKFFRFVELTCYWGLVLGFPILRAVGSDDSYFVPALFLMLSATGLAFMTRHFVYNEPHQIWSRSRAAVIVLSRSTKIALGIGYSMCVPMFVLGCIAIFQPSLMVAIIRAISPMRFLLD